MNLLKTLTLSVLLCSFSTLTINDSFANVQIPIPGTSITVELDALNPHYDRTLASNGYSFGRVQKTFILETDQFYLEISDKNFNELTFDRDGHLVMIQFVSSSSYLKWNESRYSIDGNFAPHVYLYPNARLKFVSGLKKPLSISVFSKSEGLRRIAFSSSLFFHPGGQFKSGEFGWPPIPGASSQLLVQGQAIDQIGKIGTDEFGTLNYVRGYNYDQPFQLVTIHGDTRDFLVGELHLDSDENVIVP